MILLILFWEYLKIGIFALGGGMATLPFLYVLSDKTGWFTYTQLADMIAVSESTPGPIGINMATYVGFIVGGMPGAVIATVGMIIPGLVIVLIVARILQRFRDNKYVCAAFYGLRPASAGLIAAAGMIIVAISLFNLELYQKSDNISDLVSWGGLILAAVIWVLTNVVKPTKNLHPILFIAASAVIGAAFSFARA